MLQRRIEGVYCFVHLNRHGTKRILPRYLQAYFEDLELMSNPTEPSSTIVSLADEDGVRRVVTETLFGLWAAVNSLSRLRSSTRERYRVTIFGSARTQPGHHVYEEVKRMSTLLSASGCDIVTGGGPGLMQAANEGAHEANAAGRVQSIGIRVGLPFEQKANPFVAEVFEHETFFTRLHQFVLMSDAYIVAPGGIGTVLESMMIWQLLQVRHLHDTPLVFAGPMWQGLVSWASSQMLRPGFEMASPEDMRIPCCVDTGEEAVAVVLEDHARWLATRGTRD
jgi:uncharacterized protein (TIGR00730 family)